jgi:hypothetical protein|mmetsp:Transcript_101173/g.171188  ORF Transcript_101173/g.171188 Transcript_101173/m.171188 type:complete len:150 (+) Transcript_101173:1643-2092(+)
MHCWVLLSQPEVNVALALRCIAEHCCTRWTRCEVLAAFPGLPIVSSCLLRHWIAELWNCLHAAHIHKVTIAVDFGLIQICVAPFFWPQLGLCLLAVRSGGLKAATQTNGVSHAALTPDKPELRIQNHHFPGGFSEVLTSGACTSFCRWR